MNFSLNPIHLMISISQWTNLIVLTRLVIKYFFLLIAVGFLLLFLDQSLLRVYEIYRCLQIQIRWTFLVRHTCWVLVWLRHFYSWNLLVQLNILILLLHLLITTVSFLFSAKQSNNGTLWFVLLIFVVIWCNRSVDRKK